MERTQGIVCFIFALTLSLISFAQGCSSNRIQQPTYPVSGVVTYEGKPLVGATVVFHPIDKSNFKWDELPQGVTDASGKYTLFTYASDDGAPASKYKVGVALFQPPDEDGGDQVKRVKNAVQIPLKYADVETSGLTATIDAKRTVLPTFQLFKN